MEKVKIEIEMQFQAIEELSAEERELVDAAIQATRNSYAKYSHFHVGAALRLDDGSIVIGANQENAAFPSGLCAERAAIFAAQSQSPEKAITMLAIAAKNSNGLMADPISPCGACRQVMLEMEDRYQRSMEVLLYGTKGIYRVRSVKDLLPLIFVDSNMH
ncbi:MAG: cytidine deaminase [Prevotella sp.]|nr:cytidine deaminase [Prevotella sp.]